jgi:hypothetical protein
MALIMLFSYLKPLNIFKIIKFIGRLSYNINLSIYIVIDNFWKFFKKDLDHSSSMNILGNINNWCGNLVNNHLNILAIRLFNDFLTKIISKLINHNICNYWKHKINQTFSEWLSLFWLLIKNVLNIN